MKSSISNARRSRKRVLNTVRRLVKFTKETVSFQVYAFTSYSYDISRSERITFLKRTNHRLLPRYVSICSKYGALKNYEPIDDDAYSSRDRRSRRVRYICKKKMKAYHLFGVFYRYIYIYIYA